MNRSSNTLMGLVKPVATLLLAVPLALAVVGCSNKASETAAEPETKTEASATETTETEATETELSTESNATVVDEEGDNVYTGTLSILTGEEVLKLQDQMLDPGMLEGEKDSRYAVLVFDTPTKVYARFAGDAEAMQDNEATMICLAIDSQYSEGTLSAWEQYNGKRISVEIDPMKTMWPSDVRVPLGQPHTDTAAVVAEY